MSEYSYNNARVIENIVYVFEKEKCLKNLTALFSVCKEMKGWKVFFSWYGSFKEREKNGKKW